MKHLLPILLVLTITPATILTGADQEILFSLPLDCQASPCPESVELILWKDKTEQKVKARWAMQDSGNHTYTQKAYFRENFPSTLYFTARGAEKAEIQVIPRPTFWELLKKVFKKL